MSTAAERPAGSRTHTREVGIKPLITIQQENIFC